MLISHRPYDTLPECSGNEGVQYGIGQVPWRLLKGPISPEEQEPMNIIFSQGS
jgi:hypothetical protein